jgi:hypothetical protein
MPREAHHLWPAGSAVIGGASHQALRLSITADFPDSTGEYSTDAGLADTVFVSSCPQGGLSLTGEAEAKPMAAPFEDHDYLAGADGRLPLLRLLTQERQPRSIRTAARHWPGSSVPGASARPR